MQRKLLSLFIFTILIALIFPESGFAGDDTAIGNMLCIVSSWANGNAGEGLATLAVIIIGILAINNKISWGIAIIHVVGVALLAGAGSIITALNVGGSGCVY